MSGSEFSLRTKRDRSTHSDWLEPLPESKRRVFRGAVRELESSYTMLSVALDEAFSLRESARLGTAREQAGITAQLVDRLSQRLLDTLETLSYHTPRVSSDICVSPLNTDFFRSGAGQRRASWNQVFHGMLLFEPLRLRHKIGSLRWLVEEMTQQFREAALEISEGTCVEPAQYWQRLSDLHYDLNTCLREMTVLVKSFLRALPANEIPLFRAHLKVPSLLTPQPGLRAST